MKAIKISPFFRSSLW